MEKHYRTLGIKPGASLKEIKTAFRQKAKQLHPDIAGSTDGEAMRRLIAAYQALSNSNVRFRYEEHFWSRRSSGTDSFDYKTFLRTRKDDLFSQAKLIFILLLDYEDDEAVKIWRGLGGIKFELEKYLEREDWMDCSFLLAEELEREHLIYEAFVVLLKIITEEYKEPYFKHFAVDVEFLLKELVRKKLRRAVDKNLYIECLEQILAINCFSPAEAARFKRVVDKAR